MAGNYLRAGGNLRDHPVQVCGQAGDASTALEVDDRESSGNEVVARPVRIGALHDGLRAVEDGLKAGERVIVNGLQQVRPGAIVEPKLVDMPEQKASGGVVKGER